MKIKQLVLSAPDTFVYLDPPEDWQTNPSKFQVLCWAVIENEDGDSIVGFIDNCGGPSLLPLTHSTLSKRFQFYTVGKEE